LVFHSSTVKNNQLGKGIFVHHRIISAFGRVDFVSDSVSYRVLRGRWRKITVLNVHTPSEGKKWWFRKQCLWGM